jgi:lysyl-tRNA synthetase class II
MSEDNKKLTDQLVQVILPKLKGLTEKNAKKVLNETEKSITAVVKKYSKLIADQEKEKAKAKHKAEKEAKKKAQKEAKKKEKEAKKIAKAKLLAALIAKESPAKASTPATVTKAKPRARAAKPKK